MPVLLFLFVLPTLSGCVSNETLSTVLPVLQEWWSFISFAAIAWTAGQMAKHLAPPPSTKGWKFFWRTLPYHPVVLGVLFGCTGWGPMPVALVKAHATGAMYYGAAGVLATYAHDLWKTWVKYKAPPSGAA